MNLTAHRSEACVQASRHACNPREPVVRARDAWIAAFLIAVFTPPVLRLFATEHQSIGRELVTITGLLTSSLLVCAVVLPSRLRSLTRAFGIESALQNHRVLGLSTA